MIINRTQGSLYSRRSSPGEESLLLSGTLHIPSRLPRPTSLKPNPTPLRPPLTRRPAAIKPRRPHPNPAAHLPDTWPPLTAYAVWVVIGAVVRRATPYQTRGVVPALENHRKSLGPYSRPPLQNVLGYSIIPCHNMPCEPRTATWPHLSKNRSDQFFWRIAPPFWS